MKLHTHAARLTMFIFGFLAFVLGLVGRKTPQALLKQMGFTAVDVQSLMSTIS